MLLDSDVLIDIVRRYPPALAWFATVTEMPLIPGFCAMELVSGCRDSIEQQKAGRFVASFTIVWPSEEDLNRALIDYAPLKLGFGLGVVDSLIASTTVGKNMVLATFNTKHFRAVPALQTVQPYIR